jgi:hypothetical protein
VMESVIARVSQVCVSIALELAYVGSNLSQVSGYMSWVASLSSLGLSSGCWRM